MHGAQGRRRWSLGLAGWLLVVLATLALSDVRASKGRRHESRQRRHLMSEMILGDWAQPLLGHASTWEAFRTLRRFEKEQRSWPLRQQLVLTSHQRQLLSQVGQVKKTASPAYDWIPPYVVHKTKARREDTWIRRETSKTSWNNLDYGGGVLWLTEQWQRGVFARSPAEVDEAAMPATLIKVAGVEWHRDTPGWAGNTDSAFFATRNGYATGLLTAEEDKGEHRIILRNVQAGTVVGRAPLVEKAELLWLGDNHWFVQHAERNYRRIGYERPHDGGSVWPTALGEVPPRRGAMISSLRPTHYVTFEQPGHVEAEYKILDVSFTGTLGDMFMGFTDSHEFPCELKLLELLEGLRHTMR